MASSTVGMVAQEGLFRKEAKLHEKVRESGSLMIITRIMIAEMRVVKGGDIATKPNTERAVKTVDVARIIGEEVQKSLRIATPAVTKTCKREISNSQCLAIK